jgi:predicted phosphodiesterase
MDKRSVAEYGEKQKTCFTEVKYISDYMKKIYTFICLFLITWIYAGETTRFMVVADPHNYSPLQHFEQTTFYEIVLEAIDEKVDFIFFPGDLVIRGFNETVEQDSVLKDWRFVLDTLYANEIQVFACRGNNDYDKEAWDSLFSGKYALPQNGPQNEKNITYSFEFNNILFIALDQYIELHRIDQTWLDSILVNNDKAHVFVAGHEPAFKLLHTNCMGAYPEERNIFWESLINAGVKIFFCGHDHFYDHAVIDDGDNNPYNDIHQVIVGTASSIHQDGSFDGNNGRWTTDSVYHEKKNGYVLAEVNGDDVKFTWKHRVGPFVYEYGGDSYQFLTTGIGKPQTIESFKLYQNYPNPFNPSTMITYELPVTAEVELSIYNQLGQKVTTLVSERQEAGSYLREWDTTYQATGIYFYRIKAGKFVDVKKMALIR